MICWGRSSLVLRGRAGAGDETASQCGNLRQLVFHGTEADEAAARDMTLAPCARYGRRVVGPFCPVSARPSLAEWPSGKTRRRLSSRAKGVRGGDVAERNGHVRHFGRI